MKKIWAKRRYQNFVFQILLFPSSTLSATLTQQTKSPKNPQQANYFNYESEQTKIISHTVFHVELNTHLALLKGENSEYYEANLNEFIFIKNYSNSTYFLPG